MVYNRINKNTYGGCMRKIFIGFIVLAIMLAVGCEMPTGIVDEPIGGDSSFVLNFGEPSEPSMSSRGAGVPNGMKISFRSSDIEFWSTDDFDNLQSQAFNHGDGNLSTSLRLSDTEDNVIFMPNTVKISDYDMPEFESKTYNVARMDIGGGNINFTMNGSPMNVSSSTLFGGSLNANSIVFIDEAVLSETVYVDRATATDIIQDAVDGVSGTYGVPTVIAEFVANNAGYWNDGTYVAIDETVMDVDGALFVPFTPVDLRNDNAKKVRIKIDWDLDTVFESVNGDEYVLSDVADGTPYNFDVTVEIQ